MLGRSQGLGLSYEQEVAFLLQRSPPCPPPTPEPIRQSISDLHRAGLSTKAIARVLRLPDRTVRRLVRRFRQRQSLQPDYRNAGRPPSPRFLELREQVLALRRLHPPWGAGRILVQLLRCCAIRPLPNAATVRRWLRQAGLAPPKPADTQRVPHATEPHQIWQMDAAEQVPLRTPQRVCWLRLVDEASGAVLFSRVFAQPSWPAVGAAAVQAALRQAFSRWGRPEGLRVDNGVPWVYRDKLPSDLELWLAGLGVALHRNRLRRPQQNGTVERSQGTAKNWAEPGQGDSPEQLQSRVDEEDKVQRELYPAVEGQSRLQRYPSLLHSGRGYVAGSWEQVCWSLEGALQCLGRYRGRRRVNKKGYVSLYDRGQRVGLAYAGQEVEVRLDPASQEWVFSQGAQEVGRVEMRPLSAEAIRELRLKGCPGRSAERTQARRERAQEQLGSADSMGPAGEAGHRSSL